MRAEIAALAMVVGACAPLDTDGTAPRGQNPSGNAGGSDAPSVPSFDTGFDDEPSLLSPFDGTYEGTFTFRDVMFGNAATCEGPITVVVNSRGRVYQMEGEFSCAGEDFDSNRPPANLFHLQEVSGGLYGRLRDPDAGTGTFDLVATLLYRNIGGQPNQGNAGEIGLDFDLSGGGINLEVGQIQAGSGTRITISAEPVSPRSDSGPGNPADATPADPSAD